MLFQWDGEWDWLAQLVLLWVSPVRFLLISPIVMLLACSSAPVVNDGPPEIVETFDPACYTCHGNSLSPAPPRGLGGVRALSERGVGAHRSHIGGLSTWHATIECSSCHLVPDEVEVLGHIDDGDSKAELTFSALAKTGGLSPQVNADGTCSNVYCHGATLSGASLGEPKWTQVDGSQKECGTCHGAPPPPPHTTSTDCGACHPSMQAGTNTFLDPSRHINGIVDLAEGGGCTSCHGSEQDSAPPTDLAGNTERSFSGVGAHQQHVGASDWRRTLACSNCHVVPSTVDSPGHMDDGDNQAEVPFDGLNPVAIFDEPATTCDNLYCHGDGKGSNGSVEWTSMVPMDCGSCHGFPPVAPHTTQTDCGTCHPSMQAGSQTVFRDADRHIDGVVDVNGEAAACDSCHGASGISAPPMDLAGNTNRASSGVGAHRQHLSASNWHRAVSCESCHTVPATVDAPGHMDGDNQAEVPFDALNSAGNFSAANSTCSNLHCHGNGKGDNGSIAWTSVVPMDCGSCHAYPPAAPHTDSTNCGSCHPNVTPGSDVFIDPATHIDGVVNVNAGGACDSCHGSNGVFAPPTDLAGNTNRSAPGVGAHREHLGNSGWSATMSCETCHTVPGNVNATGHLDGDNIAEVPFTALNPSATVDHVSATCNNLYCHGNGQGNNGTMDWTSTTGMECSSCHIMPAIGQSANQMSGEHDKHINDKRVPCVDCHAQVINSARQIIDSGLHINGEHDILMPQGGAYNAGTKRCSNLACHENEDW